MHVLLDSLLGTQWCCSKAKSFPFTLLQLGDDINPISLMKNWVMIPIYKVDPLILSLLCLFVPLRVDYIICTRRLIFLCYMNNYGYILLLCSNANGYFSLWYKKSTKIHASRVSLYFSCYWRSIYIRTLKGNNYTYAKNNYFFSFINFFVLVYQK
jgi:hypothetical protein